MSDEQERFKGNAKHPLVKLAANHQVWTRGERARLHAEISANIRAIGETKAQDEMMMYLIGQTSEPDEGRREAALDELERLFEREPDGRLPAQEPFQRFEDEPEDEGPDPETEVH